MWASYPEKQKMQTQLTTSPWAKPPSGSRTREDYFQYYPRTGPEESISDLALDIGPRGAAWRLLKFTKQVMISTEKEKEENKQKPSHSKQACKPKLSKQVKKTNAIKHKVLVSYYHNNAV